MKRIIALVMSCIFVLLVLVSCAESGGDETVPADTDSETLGTDDLGQDLFNSALPAPGTLNFEGYEILVYSRSTEKYTREWYKETESNDTLDLAIQKRNEQVKQELNIDFMLELAPSNADWDTYITNMNDIIIQDVSTGHFYDMYQHDSYCAAYAKLRGMQANMLDEKIFPYFDFSLPCWNQAIANTAINNKLFYMAGDLNLSLFDATMLVWHNKTMYNSVKTDKDPADLQDLAIAGDWTYDELYHWSNLYKDAGTGNACDDTYGIGDLTASFYFVVPQAWEFDLVKIGADGKASYSIIDNGKAENALSDLRMLRAQKGVNNCSESTHLQCEVGRVTHFTRGQALFDIGTLYDNEETNMQIREMNDKFCILPIPKYISDQKEYKTSAHSGFNLVSVLNHPDVEGNVISAFYQRATELSYTAVRGVYIERIVKPRYFGTNDDDGTVSKSIEIFDLVADNVCLGIAEIHGSALYDIMWLWFDGIESSDATLADNFESNNYSGGGIAKTRADYEKHLQSFNDYMWS